MSDPSDDRRTVLCQREVRVRTCKDCTSDIKEKASTEKIGDMMLTNLRCTAQDFHLLMRIDNPPFSMENPIQAVKLRHFIL